MQAPHTMPIAPASLPRRYAAWSLDAALVAVPALLLAAPLWRPAIADAGAALPALLDGTLPAMLDALPGLPAPRQLLADPALQAAAAGFSAALTRALLWTLAPFALAFCAYGAAFESARGATPGKRALGLRVVDAGGGPLPAARHVLRQAAGLLSWLSLNLGHLLALAPPRRQALHDRIAGARVAAAAAPLPGWARAWLWLQAAGLCAAIAALAFALRGAVDAAVLRVLG